LLFHVEMTTPTDRGLSHYDGRQGQQNFFHFVEMTTPTDRGLSLFTLFVQNHIAPPWK
jgi:hypothetical protein